MPIHIGTICCCTFVLLLFSANRYCDAQAFDKSEQDSAIAKLQGLKLDTSLSKDLTAYKDMLQKLRPNYASVLTLVEWSKAKLEEPFNRIAGTASALLRGHYKSYQQFTTKLRARELALIYDKLGEYKNPIRELLPEDLLEKKNLEQLKTFFEHVTDELKLLYEKFKTKSEKYFTEKTDKEKLKSYTKFAVKDQLNKITGQARTLLIELIQNIEHIGHSNWRSKRFLAWAMVEDILKPALGFLENKEDSNKLKENANVVLQVYSQLYKHTSMFAFTFVDDLAQQRKIVAMKFVEGYLARQDRKQEYTFLTEPTYKDVEYLPLHFGELIYDIFVAPTKKGTNTQGTKGTTSVRTSK